MLKPLKLEWIGGRKFYREEGTRLIYPVTDDTQYYAHQIEWANGILAAPSVTYPNGRVSHEVASQTLEEYGFKMMDHTCISP